MIAYRAAHQHHPRHPHRLRRAEQLPAHAQRALLQPDLHRARRRLVDQLMVRAQPRLRLRLPRAAGRVIRPALLRPDAALPSHQHLEVPSQLLQLLACDHLPQNQVPLLQEFTAIDLHRSSLLSILARFRPPNKKPGSRLHRGPPILLRRILRMIPARLTRPVFASAARSASSSHAASSQRSSQDPDAPLHLPGGPNAATATTGNIPYPRHAAKQSDPTGSLSIGSLVL